MVRASILEVQLTCVRGLGLLYGGSGVGFRSSTVDTKNPARP